jgi:hypothetical protein
MVYRVKARVWRRYYVAGLFDLSIVYLGGFKQAFEFRKIFDVQIGRGNPLWLPLGSAQALGIHKGYPYIFVI